MKKPLIFSIVFLTLILASVGFAISNKKQVATNDQQTPIPTSSQQEANVPENQGVYMDYSGSNLANTKGEKVLFFHAPWCPQCRSIEKGILNGGIPEGLTILKVDYDTNQDLRQKYGVTLQTTFVKINDNSELIDKYIAYDKPTFESVKENFLNR